MGKGSLPPSSSDRTVAAILAKPLSPAVHPDAAYRKRMLLVRERLIKNMIGQRDETVRQLLQEESRARVAAAVSVGLKGLTSSSSPSSPSASPMPHKPQPHPPETASKSEPAGSVALSMLLNHANRTHLLRRGFAVPHRGGLTIPDEDATEPLSASPRPLPSPAVRGTPRRTDVGSLNSTARAAATNDAPVLEMTMTSTGASALPAELVQLMRQLRGAVDLLAAKSDVSSELAAVSHRASDLSRYIANYVVRQEAVRAAELEERLLGWTRPRLEMTVPSADSGTRDDPFTTLLDAYAATPRGAGGPGPTAVPAPTLRESKPMASPASTDHGDNTTRTEIVGPDYRTLCSAAMLSIHVLLDAVVHLAQCDRGTLFLLDESQYELCSVALVGASGLARPIRVPVNHGAAGAVFRTGVSINIRNTDKAPASLFSHETQDRTGYLTRSLLCCPVRIPPTRTDRPDRLVGVVQLLNKLRPSAVSGFSPRDEELLVKVGSIIGAILSSAGEGAAFTGLLAQEEGVRSQMLLHTFRRIAVANRGEAGTRTETQACVEDITITQARHMHRQQLAQQARITSAARADAVAAVVQGLPDPLAKLVVDLETREFGATSLIYRIPRDDASPTAVGAMRTIPTDNLADVVTFLRRIEQSWREARDTCARHEATIERQKNELTQQQALCARLARLCKEAGILAEGGTLVSGGDQVKGVHEVLSPESALAADVDEFAGDDEPTFQAKLADRRSELVANHVAFEASERAKYQLRLKAASAPFDSAEAVARAKALAKQWSSVETSEEATKTPPRRASLHPESERDRRYREFREKRESFVRMELKKLAAAQRKAMTCLLDQQQRDRAALYERLLLEDREAEALLQSIFAECDGLHPGRHEASKAIESRLAPPLY